VNNGYLVPANAKKGTLIFNIFRPFDLILVSVCGVVSLLMLAILSSSNIWVTLLSLLPISVGAILVFPIPNYHNTLCAIQSIYRFYNNRIKFIWRGWCFYEQFKDDNKSK